MICDHFVDLNDGLFKIGHVYFCNFVFTSLSLSIDNTSHYLMKLLRYYNTTSSTVRALN